MSIKAKNKKYIVWFGISVFVVAIMCSLAFFYRDKINQNPDLVYARVVAILKACKTDSKTLNALNQKCVYQKFSKFVNIQNLPIVMNTLQDSFSKVDNSTSLGTTSCHIPAHIAGEVSYQKGAFFSELWEACSRNCSFGCLHGGFQGMFKEKGEELLKNLSSACSLLESPRDDDLRSCWHIVGHGVAEYYSGDVTAAAKQCLTLPFEKQRRLCILGVRMETIIPSVDNGKKIDLTGQGYLDFCNKFPVNYRDDCFAEAGYYELKISADINETIKICKSVPTRNEIQTRCVTGAGSTYFFANKNSPEAVYDFCSKYTAIGLIQECVLGATDIAASEWDHLRSGVTLCNLVDTGFKRECLAYFGERVENYNGRAKREEVCNELSAIDAKSCFSKPLRVRKYTIPVTFSPGEK